MLFDELAGIQLYQEGAVYRGGMKKQKPEDFYLRSSSADEQAAYQPEFYAKA